MKKKKSLIAIVALLLVVAVGATIAYYQSSAVFENVFNTGTYKIVTTETFESPSNWAPGQEIPKTITSTNEGTVPAAVRVSYTEQWLDDQNEDITNSITSGTAIINFDNTSDWVQEGNYYYYKYILEPGDTTSSFIRSVTLNPNINGVTCTGTGNTKTCTASDPALGATYKLTITKETVQADRYESIWNTNVSITEKTPVVTILSGTKGNLQPGDIVGIGGTEDFYVLSSDNSPNGETVLLSKYNLLVGYIYESAQVTEPISPSTPGYGLQNVDAVGYGGYDGMASIEFSSSIYWMDGNSLKNKYNPSNDIYLNNCDSNYGNCIFRNINDDSAKYPYIYDENSSLYQYINGENGYVNRLKEMGAPNSITGRLISYEEYKEYENLMVDDEYIVKLEKHSYWLGSARNGLYLYLSYVDNSGLAWGEYTNDTWAGVRPIIEIPTSEIK